MLTMPNATLFSAFLGDERGLPLALSKLSEHARSEKQKNTDP
jgi:hypothetical protein